MKIGNMGETELLQHTIKRTVSLCKAITANMDTITCIKAAILAEDTTLADQLFHELEPIEQKLLLIAPTKGGPFTTAERGILRGLWRITPDEWDNI